MQNYALCAEQLSAIAPGVSDFICTFCTLVIGFNIEF